MKNVNQKTFVLWKIKIGFVSDLFVPECFVNRTKIIISIVWILTGALFSQQKMKNFEMKIWIELQFLALKNNILSKNARATFVWTI